MYDFITDHPTLLMIYVFINKHIIEIGLFILIITALDYISNASNLPWDDMPVWDEQFMALENGKSVVKKCEDDVYRYAECRAKECPLYTLCTVIEHISIKAEEAGKIQKVA